MLKTTDADIDLSQFSDKDLLIETSEQLKAYRKSIGLTQKRFAEKFGVSELTIRRLELGITPIETSYTMRLIHLFLEKNKE